MKKSANKKGTDAKQDLKPSTKQVPIQDDFPIVGIGASAGGLEALDLFFRNVPKDPGMAFVVVQHLDPAHVGIMPELLQRITTMNVFQATDNLAVQPNCVYVIPPNKSMSLLNGALLLFDLVETRGLRLPIDIFFRSLAADRNEKSIGIVLSGMGSDGSRGLKAIKEKNGTVLVQSPATAKFDGMPQSATEAVIADIVAPAEELPSKLINFLKYIPAVKPEPEIDDRSKSNLNKIIILLREHSGHDFSSYKKNTLFRRIERRKGIHQIDKLYNYVRFCQENPSEVQILFKELLIGVTSFFRDTPMWEMLIAKVLPEMIGKLPTGYVLRAWAVACSTGEEAFSLAIAFKEALEKVKNPKNISLQVFATDIDQDAIDKARKGLYSQNIVADVPAGRLARFFKPEGENYRVIGSIREMVVFAPQNVIKDPPFTKLDIITCRNMLIYMEPELQKKLISLFNYSLNPEGIMVLGTAESLNNQSEGFSEVDSKFKIFKRTAAQRLSELSNFPSSFNRRRIELPEVNTEPKVVENIQMLADQFLLRRFAPASALVNNNGDIIYMTGHIGKYLEPVAGKANWNIYVMAREGLRNELPGAMRRAMLNFDEVILQSIKVGTNGGTLMVDVTVQRIESQDLLKNMVVLIFDDVTAKVAPETKGTGKRTPTGKMKEMVMQLQRSYEDLQGMREEMQTSQEELKSTNEELQSTNEELQSTNEELTTSKEEMQSLNEELQTVNFELQDKVRDYLQSKNDLTNLLNSFEIAILFLDKEFKIRQYTETATKIFKLRKTDIGRPFTDLASNLQYPEICDHAQQVLDTLVTTETAIKTNNGRWFNVRINPYRTIDDRINGVVITFIDITTLKHAKNLIISETYYRRIFESAKDGIMILDADSGMITDVNPVLIQLLGYSKDQFIEKAIWEIGFLKDIVANKEKFIELQKKEIVRYENLPLETADGRKINVEFVSNVYLVANVKVIQCLIREII